MIRVHIETSAHRDLQDLDPQVGKKVLEKLSQYVEFSSRLPSGCPKEPLAKVMLLKECQ
jgi:mRNA-degrading endonuclease RelE of RelBE toxin-antitoxin system